MPTGIASAMLTELQGRARVYGVFELTLDSTTHRFATEPIASESQGRYEPFVRRWGIIGREAGRVGGYSLINPRMTVDIYDKDRVLQKAIGGPSSGAVTDSTAKTILRSYYVAQASHYTLVDGIVGDYRLAGDRVYQFVIVPDDRKLRTSTNNIPTLSQSNFQWMPKENEGMDGQVVYGEHRSSSIEGATGLVNCTKVFESDTFNAWYVSLGKLPSGSVINTWKNGTLSSDFSQNYLYDGFGTWVTVVVDSTNTATNDDTITVDVDGIESDGDGSSGTRITDPIDMIQHYLVNFVFGDYVKDSSDGGWLSVDSKPINTTHLAETKTFLSDRGHDCAKVVKSSDSPLSVLSAWCNTFKVAPFWAWDWNLGVRPFNPAPVIPYVDSRHIHQVGHKILAPVQGNTDTNKVVSRFNVSYLLQDNSGAYAFQRRVEDPDRTLVSESDSFAYGKAVVD